LIDAGELQYTRLGLSCRRLITLRNSLRPGIPGELWAELAANPPQSCGRRGRTGPLSRKGLQSIDLCGRWAMLLPRSTFLVETGDDLVSPSHGRCRTLNQHLMRESSIAALAASLGFLGHADPSRGVRLVTRHQDLAGD
jgi:hypothetical protein